MTSWYRLARRSDQVFRLRIFFSYPHDNQNAKSRSTHEDSVSCQILLPVFCRVGFVSRFSHVGDITDHGSGRLTGVYGYRNVERTVEAFSNLR